MGSPGMTSPDTNENTRMIKLKNCVCFTLSFSLLSDLEIFKTLQFFNNFHEKKTLRVLCLANCTPHCINLDKDTHDFFTCCNVRLTSDFKYLVDQGKLKCVVVHCNH